MTTTLNGYCLCKSIRFSLEAPDHLNVCHCTDCRRVGGGPFIGPDFAHVTFQSDEGLKWYRSSEWAERGFCSNCGASLFYRLVETPEKIGVTSGSIENMPVGLPLRTELFIDRKPDYYAFEGDRTRLTAEDVFALYADGESETI
ncbi:MAG: GFA family protein [Pseudomonadota bacterium]